MLADDYFLHDKFDVTDAFSRGYFNLVKASRNPGSHIPIIPRSNRKMVNKSLQILLSKKGLICLANILPMFKRKM
ncbi:hypothetical protein KCU83_g275, partial [Aureobasidium melanogenum]